MISDPVVGSVASLAVSPSPDQPPVVVVGCDEAADVAAAVEDVCSSPFV